MEKSEVIQKMLQWKYRLISITSDWYQIISLMIYITFICFWYKIDFTAKYKINAFSSAVNVTQCDVIKNGARRYFHKVTSSKFHCCQFLDNQSIQFDKFFHPGVLYENYFICIFMNINEILKIREIPIVLRAPSLRIPGAPMNNLAPMKNCPGGGRLPKLETGVNWQ